MRIFITWVSSWIGKNLIERYIKSGHKVSWVVRTIEQKDKLLSEYKEISIYVCDLGDIKEVKKLAVTIKKEDFDIMIMNAGYWEYKNFLSHDDNEILNQLLINLYTPLALMSNYFKNDILYHTKIVFISSIIASMPIKKLSVYWASKWWLSHFYRVFKKENPKIKSLCIELWATQTPMHLKSWMKKVSWRDIDLVCKKIISTIERKQWIRHLYFDWWFVAKLWNLIK